MSHWLTSLAQRYRLFPPSGHTPLGAGDDRIPIHLILDLVGAGRQHMGVNIGMNCGAGAGQTCLHCHVHLIPRRSGCIAEPCEGASAVIP
ncbi:HIT domain-containing protein [Sphingomicrobium aquimarinum]|uniref:HIT domain-containing protein n=1 Tax=Sphingomicrobium aquimarinum TaxID=3133971 RepID=UPI003D7435F7